MVPSQPQTTRNYLSVSMDLEVPLVLFCDVFCPSQIIIGVFVCHLCTQELSKQQYSLGFCFVIFARQQFNLCVVLHFIYLHSFLQQNTLSYANLSVNYNIMIFSFHTSVYKVTFWQVGIALKKVFLIVTKSYFISSKYTYLKSTSYCFNMSFPQL